MEKGLKKVFSAMGAVFCAVMMIMLCQVTNAVSYSEQTVTVDYDYQVIDSFEDVDAKYVLGYSDTGITAVQDMFHVFMKKSSALQYTT